MSTPHPEVDVGGACRIQLHTGALTITVDDAALGAIAFTWSIADTAGNVCAEGAAVGSVSLTIVMPCRYATVIPGAGATTGEIVFDSA